MSDIMEILARGAQVLLALGGAYLLALWFVSIVWTFRDIESRSRNVITQITATLLPLLFPFLGIPVYLILRPKDTLDTAFQRSLEEEYLLQDLEELPLCPSCQHYVEDDFILCPHCHAQLRDPCVSCQRLVDLRWTMCPYCGAAQDVREVAAPVEAPAARWVAPALRRKRRPAEHAAAAATAQQETETEPAALTAFNGAKGQEATARRFGVGRARPETGTTPAPIPHAAGNGNGRRGRFARPVAVPDAPERQDSSSVPSLIAPGTGGDIEERSDARPTPVAAGQGKGD